MLIQESNLIPQHFSAVFFYPPNDRVNCSLLPDYMALYWNGLFDFGILQAYIHFSLKSQDSSREEIPHQLRIFILKIVPHY